MHLAGNHELYQSDVSYEMFHKWARKWGDKYLTSNVKILNKASGQFEYLGVTHRYFTTEKGLRIMAFGVLFDFTGTSPWMWKNVIASGNSPIRATTQCLVADGAVVLSLCGS